MKGLLLSLLAIGGFVYFVYKSDPAHAGEGLAGFYPEATGQAIEVTSSSFETEVRSIDAPVLAYFWAPW